MGTHKICLYKEVDKKYTGCNLKTTKLLGCALIEVCAVIWLNTVCASQLLGSRIYMHAPLLLFVCFNILIKIHCMCSLLIPVESPDHHDNVPTANHNESAVNTIDNLPEKLDKIWTIY